MPLYFPHETGGLTPRFLLTTATTRACRHDHVHVYEILIFYYLLKLTSQLPERHRPSNSTPMSTPTTLEIIHSYRHFYRALMHAVQYAKPQKYLARDQLRIAYNKGIPADFDTRKINNTLMFLENAARQRGLEHKIVKNLLHTEWGRRETLKQSVRCEEWTDL